MTRLYIVDQSGLEPGGHYYAYTGCVGRRSAAPRARHDGPGQQEVPRRRRHGPSRTPTSFRASPTAGARRSCTASSGGSRATSPTSCHEAFRRVPPSPTTTMSSCTPSGYRELRRAAALADRQAARRSAALLPSAAAPRPGPPDRELPAICRVFRHARAPRRSCGKRCGCTPTRICCQKPSRRSAACRSRRRRSRSTRRCAATFARRAASRRPGDPLTIVYLGDAREEKGYQHLPQALAYLWKDYVSPGRVRFVLQSNFNTPGRRAGHPRGIAEPRRFSRHDPRRTSRCSRPEYYEILADSDIVLIPYSAQRYRYRSSGVLVEAHGRRQGRRDQRRILDGDAGRAGPRGAVRDPGGLGPAIAEAIDRFDALSAGAEARREAALANATGENLVRHLLAVTAPAPRGREPRENASCWS